MPLISSSEERVIDSILAKAGVGVSLDKYKFKEFAFNRAKKNILRKHPDWDDPEKVDNDQMVRLIDLNLQLDFSNGTDHLVRDFIEDCKTIPVVPEITKTVEIHEEVKVPVSVVTLPTVHKDKDIDKPVSGVVGRRTRLHLACEQGNYDEVVRLVETCGAKVNIRDASNWTPKDRARMMNKNDSHTHIITYLDRFS